MKESYKDEDEERDMRIVGESSVTPDRSLVFNRGRCVVLLTRKTLLPEDIVAFRFAEVLEESCICSGCWLHSDTLR